MNTSKLIEKLQKLNFNERQSRLYIALLEKPDSTAAELHRISGTPRTKVYETLEQLVSKGYCQERIEGRSKYYQATHPDNVLELMRRKWRSEVEVLEKVASSILGELKDRYRKGFEGNKSLDFVEILRSKEQIHLRFLDLVTGVQESVYAFMKPPYASADPEVLKEQEQTIENTYRKTIHVRGLYQADEANWEWLYPHLLKSRELGEETRVIASLPVKLFVFDHRIVMLALPQNPDAVESDFVMMVVHDKGLASACEMMFDTVWEQAYEPEDWMRMQKRVDAFSMARNPKNRR